jgi:DNA-binding GntR family transcriptional regulator
MRQGQLERRISMEPVGLGLTPVVRVQGFGRTSDRVFEQLAAAIRDLRLPPGRLLSEGELAEKLHVSRTPLREAIARLAGLVQVLPQVGTLVARIRMSDVEEARFVRENLEMAAFEAACAIPDREISELRGIIQRQQEAATAGDLEAFFFADEAFHATIFAISGHPGAWAAVQRMKLQLDRLRRLSLPDAATVTVLIGDHAGIVDALEAGQVRTGKQQIKIHARRVLEHAPRMRAKHPDFFIDELGGRAT